WFPGFAFGSSAKDTGRVSASGSGIPGVSLDSAGVLSGTPTDIGSFTLDVNVGDATETITSRTFSITVNPPPIVPAQTPPVAGIGLPYSYKLAGRRGTKPDSGAPT